MADRKHETKRAINSVIRKKGRFPNLLEMCEVLSFSERQTIKYMQALEEDGYLEKIGSWYKFSPDMLKKEEGFEEVYHEIISEETIEDFPVPIEGYEAHLDSEADVFHYADGKEIKAVSSDVKKDTFGLNYVPEMDVVDDADFHVGEKAKEGFSGIEKIIKNLQVKKPKKKTRLSRNGNVIEEEEDEVAINFFKEREFKNLIDKLKRKPKKKTLSKKAKTEDISVYGMPVYIIQVLMGIIGLGAAVISVYYTTIWLIEFLPWGFALLLSSIMVGFSICAFETSILFLSGQMTKNRISKVSVVASMILLWIVVSFFSIMSTVAGQYNKHIFNLRDSTEQSRSTGRMKWDILQEKKAEIKRRLADYRQQMSVFTNIIGGMNDVESRIKNNGIWYESQYKLKQVNKKIVELNKSMDVVRTEEKEFLNQSKKTGLLLGSESNKKTKNFYSWLAGVIGIASDKIQFGMSLFPAIFVDLISPVGIAMALFLRNKYRKEK